MVTRLHEPTLHKEQCLIEDINLLLCVIHFSIQWHYVNLSETPFRSHCDVCCLFSPQTSPVLEANGPQAEVTMSDGLDYDSRKQD